VQKTRFYQNPKSETGISPNRWDGIALVIILAGLAGLAFAATKMHGPYPIGKTNEISLSPSALPGYALHTVLRMFIALFCSLLFTFIIAPLAAKNRQAEKLLIPLIDVLESIPILGVLSITVVAFIQLFPGSRLGPECAAIFAIFTSQVWNMTLSLYQSLRTTPQEFFETASVFHLSRWQQFWRIEVPFAIPALLWNTMVSMSAGWFFVVASEAIAVSNQNILLPGIGSYIRVAIDTENLTAIFYAILTMFIVILLYDQLLFRPLLTWAERFSSSEKTEIQSPRAWFYQLLAKTRWMKFVDMGLSAVTEPLLNASFFNSPILTKKSFSSKQNQIAILGWNIVLVLFVTGAVSVLWNFISTSVSITEIYQVFYFGAITTLKITLLIILASLVWVPIGVWIGLNPRASQLIQPLTQFLAAFPVNLVYPIAVTLIIHYQLNVEIWSTPLMILGTQWYILFNVIAGSAAIPKELRQVTKNLGVKRWLWWKRLVLPTLFPYYVTGAMIAAGGCWNASIVADVLEWGNHKLVATGLGSYIAEHTRVGDFPRIALGIAVMCFYVLIINHFVWRKLYQFASTHFGAR